MTGEPSLRSAQERNESEEASRQLEARLRKSIVQENLHRKDGLEESSPKPTRAEIRGETEQTSLRSARAEKRRKFKEESKGNRNKVFYAVAIFIALLGGYFWYSGSSANSAAGAGPGTGQRRSSGLFTDVVAQDGVVTLPAANFADGKAKFFTYKGNGREIDFFVLKSSDGVIRAAIDSCDVCYPYKKGYHQEGDEMVCNNCGQRFPSVKINEIKGGCNPAPLTRAIDGDNLIIKESDILKDNQDLYF